MPSTADCKPIVLDMSFWVCIIGSGLAQTGFKKYILICLDTFIAAAQWVAQGPPRHICGNKGQQPQSPTGSKPAMRGTGLPPRVHQDAGEAAPHKWGTCLGLLPTRPAAAGVLKKAAP